MVRRNENPRPARIEILNPSPAKRPLRSRAWLDAPLDGAACGARRRVASPPSCPLPTVGAPTTPCSRRPPAGRATAPSPARASGGCRRGARRTRHPRSSTSPSPAARCTTRQRPPRAAAIRDQAPVPLPSYLRCIRKAGLKQPIRTPDTAAPRAGDTRTAGTRPSSGAATFEPRSKGGTARTAPARWPRPARPN